MSKPSPAARRYPSQERGEQRVAQLLESAAAVFAEVGYEAATMTTMAERAGASIGAVYQYFSNKVEIAQALRRQYAAEMTVCWATLDEEVDGCSVEQVAHRFVDIMVGFIEQNPAYFAVIDAPVQFKRNQEARTLLRQRLGRIFRGKALGLSQDEAYRLANVAIQIVKSMNPLYRDASAKEREALVREYKQALAAYLCLRLAAYGP